MANYVMILIFTSGAHQKLAVSHLSRVESRQRISF
jgi:hypothetical protein